MGDEDTSSYISDEEMTALMNPVQDAEPKELSETQPNTSLQDASASEVEPISQQIVTSEELDELGGGEVTTIKPFSEDTLVQQSPLRFNERSLLSYLPDAQKKEYLENSYGAENIKETSDNDFAIRNKKTGDWHRADPNKVDFMSTQGLKEVASDAVADMHSEWLKIGGQMAGATAGGMAGAPTAIPTGGASIALGAAVGGGTGRMAGQVMAQQVGVEIAKKYNLTPDASIQDLYMAQAQEFAYGLTGEVTAPYIAKYAQAGASRLGSSVETGMNKLGKAIGSTPPAKAFHRMFDSVLRNFHGIPKWAMNEMHKKGGNYIMNPLHENYEKFLKPMLRKAQNMGNGYYKFINKQYDDAIKGAKNDKVTLYELYNKIQEQFPNIDISTGKYRQSFSAEANKQTKEAAEYLYNMFRKLGMNINRKTGALLFEGKSYTKTVTMRKLHDVRRVFDIDNINWSSHSNRKPYLQDMYKKARHAIKKIMHGRSEAYKQADETYSEAMGLLDEVKQATSDTPMGRWETFLEKLMNKSQATQKAFWDMEAKMAPEDRFGSDLMAWLAYNFWNKTGSMNLADGVTAMISVVGTAINPSIGLPIMVMGALQRMFSRPRFLAKMMFMPAENVAPWSGKAVTASAKAVGEVAKPLIRYGGAKQGEKLAGAVGEELKPKVAYADEGDRLSKAINVDNLAQAESRKNDNAVSEDGALGRFQIMPKGGALADWNQHHKDEKYTKEDLKNPKIGEKIADWYINEKIPRYLKHYKLKDTIENRIGAYNMGASKLSKYIKADKKLPLETTRLISRYTQAGK